MILLGTFTNNFTVSPFKFNTLYLLRLLLVWLYFLLLYFQYIVIMHRNKDEEKMICRPAKLVIYIIIYYQSTENRWIVRKVQIPIMHFKYLCWTNITTSLCSHSSTVHKRSFKFFIHGSRMNILGKNRTPPFVNKRHFWKSNFEWMFRTDWKILDPAEYNQKQRLIQKEKRALGIK